MWVDSLLFADLSSHGWVLFGIGFKFANQAIGNTTNIRALWLEGEPGLIRSVSFEEPDGEP